MATKFFLDWADFAMPNQSLDIFKQSIRDITKYDFYGERETFKAIALTNSEPLSNIEAIGLGAGSKAGNLGSAKKHKFKARIIDANSPHMFLPDPCDLAATKNKEAAVSAIQQHTDIIQINAVATTQLVSRGDIVEIQLRKNVFCYDLQSGIFNRILGKNSTADTLLKSIGCDSLPGTYGYLVLATGPIKLAEKLDTSAIPIVAGATRTGPAKITPGLGNFLLRLTSQLGPLENPATAPAMGGPGDQSGSTPELQLLLVIVPQPNRLLLCEMMFGPHEAAQPTARTQLQGSICTTNMPAEGARFGLNN